MKARVPFAVLQRDVLDHNLRRRGSKKRKRAPGGTPHPLSEKGRMQRKRSKLNTNFGALEVQRIRLLETRTPVPEDQPLW